MATTKFSVSAYTADGVTTDYLITWDYLDSDHISVYVDGTPNYDPQSTYSFELINSTTVRVTDEFGNAVPSGSEIEIRRETPILDRAVTFNDGSALLAEDLNKNSDYLLYSMQEVLDTVEAAAQDGALAAQVATEELRDQTEVLRATTEGYKNETLTARNTTQTYLATVDADATAADNHRIAAAASEAAALASKNAAAASQAASATSEANAAASEAASAASEAAAAVSEANALASKNAAATSEANAAASKTAAQTAQAAAEAALDELTDLYLGAKTAAPTVDNDGNALQTGALYWNSTNDIMYVWNGTTWDTFNSTAGVADSATSSKVFISDTAIGINNPFPQNDVDLLGNMSIGHPNYSNTGLKIRYAEGNNYGAVRFYEGNINQTTIHSFGTTWGNDFWSGSTGALNLGGLNGVTIGDWNDPDVAINNEGEVRIKSKLSVNGQDFHQHSSEVSPFINTYTNYSGNVWHKLFILSQQGNTLGDATWVYNLRIDGISLTNGQTIFWEPSWSFVLGHNANNWYNSTSGIYVNHNPSFHHNTYPNPQLLIDSDNSSGAYGNLCLFINFNTDFRIGAANFILDKRRLI